MNQKVVILRADGTKEYTVMDVPELPPAPEAHQYTETQILGQQLTDLELMLREYIASQNG